MTRSIRPLALAAVAGGAALLLTARPAAAQFLTQQSRFNYGFGPYAFNYGFQTAYQVSGVTPFGVPYNVGFANSYSGAGLPYGFNPYGGIGYGAGLAPYAGGLGYGYNPYAGGVGYGAYNPGAYFGPNPTVNPVVQDQVRRLAAGGRTGGAAPDDRRQAGAPSPTGFARPGPDARADAGAPPADVAPNLVSPPDDQVVSGRVLNELAAAIRGLEAKGRKADSPLVPADLLARVAFAGGPQADLLAAVRAGRPETPAGLAGDRFAGVRAELEQAAAAVAEPLAAGRRPEPGAADRLAAAVKRARDAADPATKDVAFADAAGVAKFLAGMDALVKAARDPAEGRVYDPNWGSVGATAAELVRHMGRHNLAFAPAPNGAEDAYRALHRGLAGYYSALAAGRR